jgi:hypothetical protein
VNDKSISALSKKIQNELITPAKIRQLRNDIKIGCVVEINPHVAYDGKSAGSAYQGKRKGRVIAKYRHHFLIDTGKYNRSFRYAECLENKTDFYISSKKIKKVSQ